MTIYNTYILRKSLKSLDAQIADGECRLFDAVVIDQDNAKINQIGKVLHVLRVERIKHQHALSAMIGYQNGT